MGIVIKNISYAVDTKCILSDISLELQQGFVGIIGPNGAGKTTLLRQISGYLKPDCGEILIDGKNIKAYDARSLAQKMALVPQNYAMEYDFTVLEIVLMGRNPHKRTFETDSATDIELARSCIRKAGIEQLESRSVIGLSGGEWQRMIIARALCQQSNILLLDEPVSNLDIKHQVGILSMVKQLVQTKQMLSVCVLHDLNLAYHYCDYIVLLKDGVVADAGKTRDVMTRDRLQEVYDTRIEVIDTGSRRYLIPVMD